MSQLESLPGGVQASIYRLVDPIGLISLSQTSSRLRRFIKPTRAHFVERLLALECLPEVGGPSYVFPGRENRAIPGFDSPEWDAMRFACPGCLRLLHHINFTHQQIVKRGLRKPIRGSPAEKTITSWEPSLNGKIWGRRLWKRRIENGDVARERIGRKKYHAATSDDYRLRTDERFLKSKLDELRQCGMQSTQDMTWEELTSLPNEEKRRLIDKEADMIEKQTCGYGRRLRRCNECRHQSKHPWRFYSQHGTSEAPMLSKCLLPYESPADRWLPGVLGKLNGRKPTVDPKNLTFFFPRHSVSGKFPLFSVRCPGCERWQEVRAMRFCAEDTMGPPVATRGKDWEGNEITRSYVGERCNRCILKQHGRQALQDRLTAWLGFLIRWELRRLQRFVLRGLPGEVITREFPQTIQVKGVGFSREAEAGLLRDWDREAMRLTISWHHHLHDLVRKGEIKAFLKRYLSSDWREKPIGELQQAEALWYWLKDCEDKIAENSGNLVDWVLNRDETSL